MPTKTKIDSTVYWFLYLLYLVDPAESLHNAICADYSLGPDKKEIRKLLEADDDFLCYIISRMLPGIDNHSSLGKVIERIEPND